MEVFLKGVPPDLTDITLGAELIPFLNALGIEDWACHKLKKRDKAWVMFLREADGRKFLQSHQQAKVWRASNQLYPGSPGFFENVANLVLLKSLVYVQQSNRPIDKQHIAHIQYEREARKRDQVSQRGVRPPPSIFPVVRIACGDNVFTSFNEDGPGSSVTSSGTADPEPKTLHFAEQTTWSTSNGKARFGNKSFIVKIQDHAADTEFRLELPFPAIHSLIAGQSSNSFTFVLTEPPRLYRRPIGSDASLYHIPHAHMERSKWDRSTDLEDNLGCGWTNHDRFVATCLVYQVVLHRSDVVGHDLVVQAAQSHDLPLTRYNMPVYHAQQSLTSFREPDPEAEHLVERDNFVATIREFSHFKTIPFPLLFQVQALVWNNYLRPASGSQMLELLERVFGDAAEKGSWPLATTDAMKHLFQRIPYVSLGVDPTELNPMDLVASVIKTESELRGAGSPERDKVYGAQIPKNQVWVFKAMVTPTRVVLNGPDAESRNRVLRMFPEHTDYFLRVQFCDEDGQGIYFQPNVSNDEVYNRYRHVLRDGLEIAGRKFSFLGFSHSSLRSHSCWFLAPFHDGNGNLQSYKTILETLGDFQNIRVPARCAARIGQAFSETPYAVPLDACNIESSLIPDVKSPDGERVFSDGVGTISKLGLRAIWPYLPRASKPTILQVRWGGVKGLLALDPRLEGKVFCVRKESMMKFPSSDLGELGICGFSSRNFPLMLNRQLIKIMEDMGTSNQWFQDQQKKALDVLRGVTATATSTAAFMELQSIGVRMGFPKLIKQLERLGIDYRRDPFLKSVVEHTVLCELRSLKHRARIPVDGGATLFGIMDETGFLEEGQVFITFDLATSSGRRRGLEDGRVIVTRSPALHPGDIQIAEMVTPPPNHPLHEHENCIIFSQKGTRDLPSQLSGGDLDGDLYHVIWDAAAMPKETFAPADYPRVTAEPLDHPVTREDMADFFINFMKSDVLGMIATRHVVLADVHPEGTLHDDCISLAHMHSTAVDFSKTGIPVITRDMPKPPRFRPDFLAPAPPIQLYDRGQIEYVDTTDDAGNDDEDGISSAQFRYYKSEKILGWLYRNVDEKKIWAENIQQKVNMDGPSVWEQFLGLIETRLEDFNMDIDHTRRLDDAWKIRNLYESTLYDNMWHFSDNPRTSLTEVEAFCGFIFNKKGSQTRRQRDSSVKLKEEIDRMMSWIVKLIRDRNASDTDDTASVTTDGEGGRSLEAAVELCWACVAVGCSPKEGSGDLQSFKMVASCCFIKELNALSERMCGQVSGGFVGLGRGSDGQTMTLPIREGRA